MEPEQSIAPADKPAIFVLTFGTVWQQSMVESVHSSLLTEVDRRSTILHATTAQEALGLFAEYHHPKAVLVADPAIMASRNEVISQKLVQYATNGGIVVFGCVFSTCTDSESLDRFFAGTWDLPWEAGSQHRTTLALNPAAVKAPLRNKLYASYSQQALFLQGVEHHESWYLPTKDSIVESFVPLPGPVTDLTETPIALAQFGKGRVGYVGDIEAEQGTVLAVLGMMGLLV